MKIKKGLKWKAIEGLCKGKEFTVIKVTQDTVTYRSETRGSIYDMPKNDFEKYLNRVQKYWKNSNLEYKIKKEKLRKEL